MPDGPAPAEAAWPHHALLTGFVVLWGGNFVLAEVALREMSPLAFSVARFVMGGAAMLSLLYGQVHAARRDGTRLFPAVQRRHLPRLLLVSVLGATLAPWLGIEGLGLTHGARASLWLALGPVLSAGLGLRLGTERIGPTGYAGIALAGLGTFALAFDGLRPEQGYWLGDLLLLLALACAVAELHLIKPLARRYGATATVAARTALGGAVYVLVAVPALAAQPWMSLGGWTWFAILFGGAVGVGVGQWVKVRALHALGPTRVVLYGNLVPLAALGLAWLALRHEPAPLEVAAAVLIIAGAVCLQVLDPARQGDGRRATPL